MHETPQTPHKKEVHSFGEKLFLARDNQGIVIEEVSKSTHLPVSIIDAIERSNTDELPEPIYVQGYIKAYAKYLGIDANPIIEEFNRAVPHELESSLTPPPSVSAKGPNSNTPLIKAVSILLLVLIVMTSIYAVFRHYSEVVESMNVESAMSDDMETIGINSFDVDADYPEHMDSAVVELQDDAVEAQPGLSESKDEKIEDEITEEQLEQRVIGTDTERAALIKTSSIADGVDTLNVYARKASWVEVTDANGVKLHYNLVRDNKTITLTGTAPFDVFLGNAPVVDMKINDVEIDMKGYVRTNNIAHFKVSMNDNQVVFH